MQAARTETELEIDVGAIVAGRYRLERLLGRGGMGEVWSARHASLDTPYAIKFLDRSLLHDDDRDTILKRFSDEAKASSTLSKQSRHIVSVHDYGEHGGVPFLVMELLVGESVDQRLETRGPMTPEDALAVLTQVSRALGVAHKAKLIHRDLKPGNVFLCKDEDGELLVKVLDFGLVRSIQQGDKNITQKGIAVGTPTYMSPEQARALPTMDHQCDVWSMAVLSYAMLTGKTPWPGETMQDVLVNVCRSEYVPLSVAKPELGAPFDPFYARAFQRKAEHRYVDAEQMVDAFRLCAGAPRTSPPIVPDASSGVPVYKVGEITVPTPTPQVVPGVSDGRSRRRWWAGAAAMLMLLGFAFVFSRKGGTTEDARASAPKPTAPPTMPTETAAKPREPEAISPSALPLAPITPKATADARPSGKVAASPGKGGSPTAPVATGPATAPQPPRPTAPAAAPSAAPAKPHDPSAVL